MAKALAWLNPSVWAGGSVPAAAVAYRALNDELGANPIAEAMNRLGMVSLVMLIATLAVTPLQKVTGWTWPPRIRRALGQLAFGYVTLHFLVYLGLDLQFALGQVLEDVAKRPFITVGFTAWLLLIPLAVTSTDAMVRRLGYQLWKKLHRLAYLCAALGVVHFYWRVKKDHTEPLIFGAVLGFLLLMRVVNSGRKKRAAA
jgi:sulfoxide reductase heme-binding subunit YedZ